MPSAGPIDVGAGRGAAEVAEVRRRIDRRREVPQQLRGDAVRPRLQDEVAELRGLDGEGRAARARLPQAFVRREEEEPVADDRPAEAVAELVLAELRDRRSRRRSGPRAGRSGIVRPAAAELVGAGLRDHLDLRAGVAAVHRREIVGDDPHFLDRFGVGRQVGDAAAGHAVGAGVVDGERVGLVALAAGVDARRGFAGERIVRAAAAADRRRDALARSRRAAARSGCRDSCR